LESGESFQFVITLSLKIQPHLKSGVALPSEMPVS